ncbi:3-hydroxyisobutyrate dehydrogenase [Flexibacterium corallicola]|uniref:3-hydroxyisobutyrate dehydrogenase n=1 Tax=Flexibacterium corallicola TaxID=3037259 RepID=UPI00286ED762|nr:3-hydroxyisobutyrate dehydrogenase [Pseudovibrio sp. M1P-2-3]
MSGAPLKIGFIGLGNMGGPMAVNLVNAGHIVSGYDLSEEARDQFSLAGGKAALSLEETVKDAQVVITMLPAGKHVKAVYLGDNGIFELVGEGTLLIDSSTIDVESARYVSQKASEVGHDLIDAPVSGGVAGASSGSLTFMVGGHVQAVERAKPILEIMGKSIVHAGEAGAGQAAKICNNMLLGVSMIGTCEAFLLADKLGLDRQKLFDISSASSGQCWALTSYCPVPGPVPSSPANNDYQAGFSAAMMLKDLLLAKEALDKLEVSAPMGQKAAETYEKFCLDLGETADFSGIINFLRKEGK